MTSATRSDAEPRRLFWVSVLLVWSLLVIAYVATVLHSPAPSGVSPAEAWALAGVGAGSSLIWFGGIRHLAMWMLASRRRVAPRHPDPSPGARVALLYTMCDDGNFDALRRSMMQNYPVTTVILDDSQRTDSRVAVNEFAAHTGIHVIRRADRRGFKAGSLNNALRRLMSEFDFFVIVDSDEVLPEHFVSRALADFASSSAIGIVQGRHRAPPGPTRFSGEFSGMLESQVSVAQHARSRVGLAVFMGRGAMISSACLRAAGPLPEVVTEDVAFTVEARIAEFEVYYDDELISVEDFPVDYHAFRTQYRKTVAGTTEFLMSSSTRIVRSRLLLSEKVDLLAEQILTPAIAVAAMTLLVSGVVLAASGGDVTIPLWSIVVTGLLGLSALLPETLRIVRAGGVLVGVRFLFAASALYGSMLLTTLSTMAGVLIGKKAVFVVTPKEERTGSLWSAIGLLRLEFATAVIIAVVTLVLAGSIVPAMPVLASATVAICFAGMGVLRARPRRAPQTTPLPVDSAV